ncbi:hypothetical protein COLINT_02290 [Collinsella intestinalis DSM 13280]|uniref:Uncharacterized protein n=1 Tax=Collinsella intestinalis DSM 13280 TaxID=521003 RepID=C4F8C0_9ACTN|nr:hypothetical protein COLINT_02290 [Collinsella intestinalis DSM 13280]
MARQPSITLSGALTAARSVTQTENLTIRYFVLRCAQDFLSRKTKGARAYARTPLHES